MDKIYFSPKKIDSLELDLLHQIRKSKRKFSAVIGLAEGGLHISRPIAKILDLPHYSIKISYYDGEHKRRVPHVNTDIKNDDTSFSMTVPFGKNQGPVLIIDDLIDSGETIQTLKTICGFRKGKDAVAVLFWNKSAPKPDFYVKTKPNAWVVFYWEQE
jgi:hypoxanthine phosphoribosyltransferase